MGCLCPCMDVVRLTPTRPADASSAHRLTCAGWVAHAHLRRRWHGAGRCRCRRRCAACAGGCAHSALRRDRQDALPGQSSSLRLLYTPSHWINEWHSHLAGSARGLGLGRLLPLLGSLRGWVGGWGGRQQPAHSKALTGRSCRGTGGRRWSPRAPRRCSSTPQLRPWSPAGSSSPATGGGLDASVTSTQPPSLRSKLHRHRCQAGKECLMPLNPDTFESSRRNKCMRGREPSGNACR